MRRTISTVIAAAVVTMFTASAGAQTTTQTGSGKGGSAHVKTAWEINGANISIEYGRPSLKGRPESQMMPNGLEWRTGADEATVITSDKPLTFGAVSLAPGSYTINTVPGATEWKLVLGKLGKAGQWGVPYLPALEIGRTAMKLGRSPAHVELVTYSIDPSAAGGTLRIEWGTTSVTTPFTIGK
jgi:Protein of unknown function (DUF2911)